MPGLCCASLVTLKDISTSSAEPRQRVASAAHTRMPGGRGEQVPGTPREGHAPSEIRWRTAEVIWLGAQESIAMSSREVTVSAPPEVGR